MDKSLLRYIDGDIDAALNIRTNDGTLIATVPHGGTIDTMENAWREARLIAAAPLMLRCVEQFSAAMHALGIDAELYDGIVAYVEGVKED